MSYLYETALRRLHSQRRNTFDNTLMKAHMAQDSLPVVAEWGDDGELVRVLIHHEWFDRLAPVFRAFKRILGATAVSSMPDYIVQELQEAFELIRSLTLEFGVMGWGFSISLIYILQWAASKGASIGKFVYEAVGGYGNNYGRHYGRQVDVVTEID